MARPLRISINSGLQGWDALLNDNLILLLDKPIPLPDPGVTESNVASTYPPASYAECVLWVNHSVVGKSLYWSDGTNWIPFGPRLPTRTSSATITQLAADVRVRFTGAGTVDYDFLTASAWSGRTVIIRNDSSGTVSLDPNGSELINGSSSSLSLAAGSTATVFSDGTDLYASIQT